MITEEYNKGVCFRAPNASYWNLCRSVSEVPGVVFTERRRFFWSGADVGAKFIFRGHKFVIEPDRWDGALWILAEDHQKHEAEMEELRNGVEKFRGLKAIIGCFRGVLIPD
jgi:hypothetical protein